MVNRKLGNVMAATLLAAAASSSADWQLVRQQVLDVCDTTPWSRRIYSYDLDVDTQGVVHVVYAKPAAPDYDRDEIVYARGSVGSMAKTTLDANGKHFSISTFLVADRTSNVVHICYHRGQAAGEEQLIYRTAVGGAVSAPTGVEPGAWHTRMQLDESGWPLFVRQGGSGLRLFTATGPTEWRKTAITTTAAGARLADFQYDRQRGVYHITWGDNAVPNGYNGRPYHRFWHTRSDNGSTWAASMIDGSLTLWEDEFWTSLVLDSQGAPRACMYKFNTYNGQYNTGTSLLLARYSNGSWNSNIIAGAIPGGPNPDHRAGMGAQLAMGDDDRLFGAWDDSPDHPIDFSGAYGNIVLQSSPDSQHWQYMQQLQPFSAEGFCRLKVYGNKAYLLVLGDWHDTKLYLMEYNNHFDLWSDAASLGNSWHHLDWFGSFSSNPGNSWIYHLTLGWLYAIGSSPADIWFYSLDLGWLWTSSLHYPALYSCTQESWLYYAVRSTSPRMFYNFNQGAWVTY